MPSNDGKKGPSLYTILTGISFGAVGVAMLVGSSYLNDLGKARLVQQSALQQLRLSERKTSTLSYDARKTTFKNTVVPFFSLKPGTLDYDVLHTVCVDGVYGAKPQDWNVDTDKAEAAYNMCGWNVPDISIQTTKHSKR